MNERLEQYDGTTAGVLTDTNRLWGNSIRPVLGLESPEKVFERYRAIRKAEREYV